MNWTKSSDKIVLFSPTEAFSLSARSSRENIRGKTLLFDVCPNRTNGEEGKQVAELIIEDIRNNEDVYTYTAISFVNHDSVKINKVHNVFNVILFYNYGHHARSPPLR